MAQMMQNRDPLSLTGLGATDENSLRSRRLQRQAMDDQTDQSMNVQGSPANAGSMAFDPRYRGSNVETQWGPFLESIRGMNVKGLGPSSSLGFGGLSTDTFGIQPPPSLQGLDPDADKIAAMNKWMAKNVSQKQPTAPAAGPAPTIGSY